MRRVICPTSFYASVVSQLLQMEGFIASIIDDRAVLTDAQDGTINKAIAVLEKD